MPCGLVSAAAATAALLSSLSGHAQAIRSGSGGSGSRGSPLMSAPQHLRVENLLPANQLVVLSESKPRFAFHHAPLAAFGVTQASYHITVSLLRAGTNKSTVVWDSGDVVSTNTSEIVYGQGGTTAATPLVPFSRYRFCVWWTASDPEVGTSPQACAPFETGPMQEADWQGAGWLIALSQAGRPNSDTQYRHTFSIPHPENIEFARVYVAAAGCAHVEVNGAVPLPDMRGICPWVVKGTTMRSIRYMTHRIGDVHDDGGIGSSGVTLGEENVIGVISGNVSLADRHWTPPGQQLLLLMMIKFLGEAQPFFLSSSSRGWQSASSYVVSDSAWDTTIDWREHEHGWSTPAFEPNPARWLPAAAPIPANGTISASYVWRSELWSD
jgi:hypothetical protein